MIRIETGTFAELRDDLWQVRHRVFVIEQNVPEELEADDRDDVCIHIAAYRDGQPIGSGRFDPDSGKVGRVAVLKDFRKQGIGRMIMQAIENVALEHGRNTVWFHAQMSVVPFYTCLGYETSGDVFIEADIPHRKMEKVIGE